MHTPEGYAFLLFFLHTVAELSKLFPKPQIISVRVRQKLCLVQTKTTIFIQELLIYLYCYHFGKKHVVASQALYFYYLAFNAHRTFFNNRCIG